MFTALILSLISASMTNMTTPTSSEHSDGTVLTCDYFILDSHADTPLDFAKGAQLGEYDPKIQVSIPRLLKGGVKAQYLACWVKQEDLTEKGRNKANDRIIELIDSCYRQIAKNEQQCGLAVTADDVNRLNDEGKIAFLIGVENGYGIGTNLDVIDYYKKRGVSYITLCHTKNNDICDSSSDKDGPLWHGLSPFGEDVIARMNALGILVDLSHASEETFWDVLRLSRRPVVCTHSSSKAVFDHDRNLTDEQIRALAEMGGIVQVCAVDEFLCDDPKNASIDDFINHLMHVVDVAGIDHVGIGTDFDGGGGVKGFNGSEDFVNVIEILKQKGFSDSDLSKLLGGNFLNLLNKQIPLSI